MECRWGEPKGRKERELGTGLLSHPGCRNWLGATRSVAAELPGTRTPVDFLVRVPAHGGTFHHSAPCGSISLRWRTGAMSRDEHVLAHVINIGRFWTFSVYYVVSELWGSVSWLGRLRVAGVCAYFDIQA